MNRRKAVWAALLWAPTLLRAQELTLPLAEAEASAVAGSPQLAAQADLETAAASRARAQNGRRAPALSLDGTFRYLSEIPAFRPTPLAPPVEMGDHRNYSLGPTLAWTAWDSGALRSSVQSFSALAAARTNDRVGAERRLRLSVQLTYFQVRGSLERLRLVADALRLAQAQHADIDLRRRAGAASREDALKAHGEVLARRRTLREAQTELAGDLRDLQALANPSANTDLTRPWPRGVDRPADVPVPSITVALDDEAALFARFEPAIDLAFDARHPDLESLADQARAADRAAAGLRAGHGPAVVLSARSSRDYPNGPVHETITQNSAGANLRWSLFEGGRAVREAEEQASLARAARDRRRQTENDLRREWAKARDRWTGAREETELNRAAVQERTELARLTYDAYRAGRTPFLEVQSANLQLLDAQTALARSRLAELTQLAVLESLASKGSVSP